MLNLKLENGQKIPKWNSFAPMGQFLGFSDDHLSLVTNIRNLRTVYLSLQYHIVFDDDFFKTVFSTG